jgi:hypothetical protein
VLRNYWNGPYTLECQGHDPFFDVDSIQDANDVVRQLIDIAGQPWASSDVLKDLISAMEYLLDPSDSYRFKSRLRTEYEASKTRDP